jgi:hypothetical protein
METLGVSTGQVQSRKALTGDNSEGLNVDGRKLLEWILNMLGGCGLYSSGSGMGPVTGFCEHGNEHEDSKKRREFLN